MIPGFSGEMIFLFFLALILFGPKKLPEIGRQIGRIMNEFRRASNEFRSQIESEINSLDLPKKPQILPPIKEPLGSLAGRIFNPRPAPKLEAVEKRAETMATQSEGSSAPDRNQAGSAATGNPSGLETQLAASPAASSSHPRVAPDA